MQKKEAKKICSKCSEKFDFLNRLDKQSRKKLVQKGIAFAEDALLCKNCLNTLWGQAYVTPLEKKIKIEMETRKQKLWFYRMQYLKKAQEASVKKNVKEAIKNYQLYLKILEEYYEISHEEFNPSFFITQKDAVEKNIVATVLSELVKLFDSLKNKEDGFSFYLEKLILFLPGSSKGKIIYDNLRRYSYSKFCVHKEEFSELLKKYKKELGSSGKSSCYVASLAFDNYNAYEVKLLRYYRDVYLKKYFFGRVFISCYYFISPYLVKYLNISFIKNFLRFLIRRLIYIIYRGAKYRIGKN